MKTNGSTRICLQCNKEINNSSIKICPDCQCIDIMDKNNYYEIINNYKRASNSAKQMFYNDPVFIKIMCYKPDEFKRESPVTHNNIVKSVNNNSPNIPHCPTCGSTNVRKISTLNRAVSISILGIFSGKIGKNYECLNCKSKW